MSKSTFTTPVGRLVMGSLYKPLTRDAEGKPLVYKSGANIGQARSNYFMSLAVLKQGESHWNQTEWGNLIFRVGAEAFPQAHRIPSFSWKVIDGDDQTPNLNGRRPVDNEGWKGNWVLKFSGSFAPKVYRQDNGAHVQVTEPDFIKPGYYVQIAGSVDSNGSQQRPGLFLNHSMVALSGYGPEIHFGANVEDAGFGQSPMPAGVSAVPLGSSVPLPSVPAPAFASAATIIAPAIANVPVAPKPSFLMTPKAAGASHEAFKAAGWDDSKLIADGYMVSA